MSDDPEKAPTSSAFTSESARKVEEQEKEGGRTSRRSTMWWSESVTGVVPTVPRCEQLGAIRLPELVPGVTRWHPGVTARQ